MSHVTYPECGGAKRIVLCGHAKPDAERNAHFLLDPIAQSRSIRFVQAQGCDCTASVIAVFHVQAQWAIFLPSLAGRPNSSRQYFCGTAPTHHLYGLREALDMIAEEGLEAVWERHERL
ncbi:MAG: hypothetical protein AAFY09_12090, partial [Pseudomonadota bacterium]